MHFCSWHSETKAVSWRRRNHSWDALALASKRHSAPSLVAARACMAGSLLRLTVTVLRRQAGRDPCRQLANTRPPSAFCSFAPVSWLFEQDRCRVVRAIRSYVAAVSSCMSATSPLVCVCVCVFLREAPGLRTPVVRARRVEPAHDSHLLLLLTGPSPSHTPKWWCAGCCTFQKPHNRLGFRPGRISLVPTVIWAGRISLVPAAQY